MTIPTYYKRSLLILFSFALFACGGRSIPEKAHAVEDFDVERYLGTWYEIARFDFYFERDLDNTTASYSLNEDGNVQVINRGFHIKDKEWKQAEGLAKFRGNKHVAELKVSFFGPFYSGYNVIALDADYQYALVAGKSLDYLWILSREKTIPETVKQQYLTLAQEVGYDVSRLIWVNHNKEEQVSLPIE
ncbi:lipocalin family protein [Myroides sp. mNGS23_01]|nr:lipocalin family protein [Myroides sp. mNGS23_01]WHT39602.1 lipocalin family protein [Myroides sp. mNGS23_01]